METLEIVLTGIISSLVATFIFLGGAFIFRKHVSPWIEDSMYKGVRIDGHWKDADIDDESSLFSALDLKQKASEITGIYSHGNDSDKTSYKVRGEIQNTYVNASFWPISSKLIDSFTFLGRVYHSESNLRIKGVISYVSNEDGSIQSTEAEFVYRDS